MNKSAQESAQQTLARAYEREQREIKRRLGDGLRRTYDPTVREPLPSDWLKLLDSLRKRLSPHK
jgi:urease accessory protein UreF